MFRITHSPDIFYLWALNCQNGYLMKHLYTRIAPPAVVVLLLTFVVNSCKKDKPEPDPAPCSGVEISFSVSIDAEGAIAITNVQGGTSPYRYAVDNSGYQESRVFEGPYQNGSYSFKVKDSKGCEGVAVLPVSRPGEGGGCDGALTITDADGNTYNTVRIGSQCWTKENLKTGKYADGSSIPNVTGNSAWANLTTGAWCYYDNSSSTTHGKLYNWYAVADPRGLCPTGWHVPTDAEWKTLELYLGMSQMEVDLDDIYDLNNRGASANVGGKLKATMGWVSNEGATNESGFEGLPGGFRLFNIGETFYGIGRSGVWWSSSTATSTDAWYRELYYEGRNVSRAYEDNKSGLSVRCVRD